MGKMSAELFAELASIAHVRSTPGKPDNERSNAPGFTEGDIRQLEGFKDAVFQVLMLRARNHLILTKQERDPPVSESELIALTGIEMALVNASIHKGGAFNAGGVKFMIIPPRPAAGLLDTADIDQILARFGKDIVLACKQNQFSVSLNE